MIESIPSRANKRHYDKVYKKRNSQPIRFAKKCSNAKCMICHSYKVMGITPHRDNKKLLPFE